MGITAAAAHVHTQRAYARTMAALGQAETTSKLALDVLDNIYQQLSPDRYWILSDRDGTGELCVCLGLRSASGSPSGQRAAMQVEASEETASLLEGLSVFYDRLAEQTGDDFDVQRQSAIAGRRVGDIRQRLGHLGDKMTVSDFTQTGCAVLGGQAHQGRIPHVDPTAREPPGLLPLVGLRQLDDFQSRDLHTDPEVFEDGHR